MFYFQINLNMVVHNELIETEMIGIIQANQYLYCIHFVSII